MEWTPSQQEAIEYKGENILLSAAAGSGKTAVLVQRVINKILDKKNPVSINELLILTFTDAAAAEMKRKISSAINREFLSDPSNLHLKKQRLLIGSANISTIHSFCMEVIKSNIHKTDIPMNFSIISEIENTMLKEKALDAVLAGFYESFDLLPSFKKLVLGYGSDKSDKNLRKIIRDIMEFSQSMPYPAKWLNNAATDYKFDNFSSSSWHKRLFLYSEKLICRIEEIYNEILKMIESDLNEGHPYYVFFQIEKGKINDVKSAIKEADYKKTYEILQAFKFKTLPTVRTDEPREHLTQDNVKSFRNFAKKKFATLSELFSSSEDTVIKQLRESEPLVRTLKNIVLITLRLHKRMKRQKDYLDFNDLEHELIKLLSDNKGNPTDVAYTLKQKYKEILVDEYQDTNHIQDKMFSLISRDDSNIFTVGDIKQSIYKFRNAVPEIFAEKYRRYGQNEGGHLICLSKNFRSRNHVISFTNFVFEKIMNEATGGTAYGESEKLILGADYLTQDNSAYIPEFNIIDGRESEDGSFCEAVSVAHRINQLINEEKLSVTDSITGMLRPVKYSDIVILVRNTKNIVPIFQEVFENHGIPLYSETGQSYLKSIEVQTILSYLSIIDNPHQDIPLIAVLRSPIWRFTPEMLSKIRSKQRKGDFYDAIKNAAKNGDKSCARFVADLMNLRIKVEYMKVSDIILTLYKKYNYNEIISGMPNNKQRVENLRLLFERASDFDTTDNKGLFSFMLYIETILDSGKDLSPAKVEGENSNVVRIMSIHKSKGLEFPVVILANAFGRFNTDDLKKSILRHDSYGFGLKYADTERRIIYPSIPHKIISGVLSEELLAEEMRLLYVALTRAKEKLIVSAVIKSRTSRWASPYLAQDNILEAGILNACALGDWISYALARHNGACVLQNEYTLFYEALPTENLPIKITLSPPLELPENSENNCSENTELSDKSKREIIANLNSKYAFSNPGIIPVKMSVSEAKRRQTEEDIYSPHIFSIPTMSAKDSEMVSATDRGTITHFALQHIDLRKTCSIEEIDKQIYSMIKNKLLTRTQGEIIDRKSIFSFFQSPLGIRLKNAVRVWKEFNFYTKTNITDFYPNLKQENEKILLQGTIDCFFKEENGNIVLLDYKTDKISEKDILTRGKKYLIQLKYYKQGLEDITKQKITDAYIHFLSCNKSISLDELENNSI